MLWTPSLKKRRLSKHLLFCALCIWPYFMDSTRDSSVMMHQDDDIDVIIKLCLVYIDYSGILA